MKNRTRFLEDLWDTARVPTGIRGPKVLKPPKVPKVPQVPKVPEVSKTQGAQYAAGASCRNIPRCSCRAPPHRSWTNQMGDRAMCTRPENWRTETTRSMKTANRQQQGSCPKTPRDQQPSMHFVLAPLFTDNTIFFFILFSFVDQLCLSPSTAPDNASSSSTPPAVRLRSAPARPA